MKMLVLLLSLATPAVAAPVAMPSELATSVDENAPLVAVRVAPIDGRTFEVEATIADRGDGKLLSNPILSVLADEPAVVELSNDADGTGHRIRFEVTVARDGRSADYLLETWTHAGRQSEQRGRVDVVAIP